MSGRPTIADIQQRVAQHYGFDRRDLLSRSRRRDLCRARHVAMFVARTLSLHSYESIGRAFDVDHSSVMHGCARVMDRQRDPRMVDEITGVIALCRKGAA